MRRIWIAGACVAGIIIPVIVMTVFLFGCCVLPFHHVIHRIFPFCGAIVKLLAPESHHEAVPAKTRSKQTTAPIIFARRLATIPFSVTPHVPAYPLRWRDRIAHGALRCDDDVGLYLVISVLLI